MGWKQAKYGPSKARPLPGGIQLIVTMEMGRRDDPTPRKWLAIVNGLRLKGRWDSPEEAQRAAEEVAARWLGSALDQLKMAPMEGAN